MILEKLLGTSHARVYRHLARRLGEGLMEAEVVAATGVRRSAVNVAVRDLTKAGLITRQAPAGVFSVDTSQPALDAYQALDATASNQGVSAWGDYDDDGDPDLIISGPTASGCLTRTYRNDPTGQIAEDALTGLHGLAVCYSYPGWGDFDLDGDLDLIGWDPSEGGKVFKSE